MVLVDHVPSYPSAAAASLPVPPPAIATAVLGVPTTAPATSGATTAAAGAAATGIPAAPATNRTAFLGVHLGVRASPLEAFVSTDPSDYAYGAFGGYQAERSFFVLLVLVVDVRRRDGGPSNVFAAGRYFVECFRFAPSCRLFPLIAAPLL